MGKPTFSAARTIDGQAGTFPVAVVLFLRSNRLLEEGGAVEISPLKIGRVVRVDKIRSRKLLLGFQTIRAAQPPRHITLVEQVCRINEFPHDNEVPITFFILLSILSRASVNSLDLLGIEIKGIV